MIEGRSPPGVMAVLDDTSLTMNAVSFSFFCNKKEENCKGDCLRRSSLLSGLEYFFFVK
jgi:hypothetical protein